MNNIKNSKRLLALFLSLIMCFGLLQTTSLAASWNPGDLITINVRVYDASTGAAYNVGTDYVAKGDQYIQSVAYQIPALTKFVSASQFGRVTKVVGNWYFPSGDSQPGATVEWSCNVNSVTMTYWVNWYSPGTGGGTGSNQNQSESVGGSGSYSWTQYIRYHSNYPDGTDYIYTVAYNVRAYTTIYNTFGGIIKSLSAVGFSVPNGYTAKSPIWNTAKDGTGTGYSESSSFVFYQSDNGKYLDLYAQWEPAGGTPVTPVTLTYMDGSTVYATRDYFAGDTATAILCTTEKSGYTFAGWDTSSSAQTVVYLAGSEFTINSNMTLYAVWEKDVPTHSVTRGADGTMTLLKQFTGADMPASFLMYYEATNEATGGVYNYGFLTFTQMASGLYSATVNYPTWEFTGDWTSEEKQAYDSIITFTEFGADVAGMDLTITANGAVVDQSAKTITYTVDAQTSYAGLEMITNAYTSSSVTPENPKLTGIEKERLTSDPGSGVDVAGVSFARVPALGEDDTSVKLLYSITVYGDEGAEYIVTDDGAVYAGGDPMEGVIGESGTAVIYVTKVFGLSEISAGAVTNIAYVAASGNTEPIPGSNPAPSEEVSTVVLLPIDVDKDGTDPDDAGISNFTVKVTNTTGSPLGFMWLTDTMDTGMEIITDSSGNPVYSLKFYAKDGTEIDSIDYDARTVGQTTTWVIQALIEQDAVIELTYQAKITSETGEKLKNKVKAEYSIYEPTRLIAEEADLSLFFDSREYDVSGNEAICEIDTSNIVH